MKQDKVKLVLKAVVPIVLLVAGLVLLSLDLPGWKLILGIPTTMFGVVFLVYTYDDLFSGGIVPHKGGQLISCSLCGKITPKLPGLNESEAVCGTCRRELREGVLKATKKLINYH